MFDDAPLDQAVEGIVNGIYFNQGHVCCAGSRLLVQESVFEPVLEKLKDRLQTLRVGDPLDKNTDVGRHQLARRSSRRSRSWWQSGVEEGAEMLPAGMPRSPSGGSGSGPRCSPGVSQSHRIAREEIFGPVLSILTFRTPDEAVEKANNTPYGLSAGVWTEKGSRILWMAERLRAGVVWANTFNRFDPGLAVRRVQGERVRPGGRRARAGPTWTCDRTGAADEPGLANAARTRRASAGPAAMKADRLDVRKTYKLYIGGAFPRSESGRSYPVAGADGERAGPARARLAQGPPRRGRGPPAARSPVVRAPPRTTGARCCTGSPS